MKVVLFFIFTVLFFTVFSQCVSVNAGLDQSICPSTTNLTMTYTPVKATTSYTVAATTYAWDATVNTSGTTAIATTSDDIYSALVPIGFCFQFYGNTYTQLVIGSNGLVTFDAASASAYCPYSFTASLPSTSLPMNSIMAPYHDIDPSKNPTGLVSDIKYKTIGTAPCRTFIVSWSNVPMYSSSCNNLTDDQQLVLYETTNNIDVMLKNKPLCSSWNGGLAILGIQNSTGTLFSAAPGYNSTQWSTTNTAYRFSPAGAEISTVKWLQSATLLSSTTTASVTPSVTTTYTAELTIPTCAAPGTLVITDQMTVTITSSIVPTFAAIPSVCEGSTAPILPLTSLNGITGTWSSAVSTVTAGTFTYTFTPNAGQCASVTTLNVTVNANPVLTIVNPTAVCLPGAIDLTAAAITAGSTGGGTLSYWTNIGCTTPLATPTAVTTSGTYYIQSTLLTCKDIESVLVTISPAPVLAIVDPAAVCSPLTVDLTLAAVTTGSTGAGTLSYWTNVGCTNPLASPSAVTTSGTYYIKSTVGTCVDSKPVNVVVNTTPVLTIVNPAAVCLPGAIDITAAAVTTGSTGGGTLSYWTNIACTAPLATPTAVTTSGTYYIQSTLLTCTDIESVLVTISPAPVLTIVDPLAVCSPSTVDLTLASVTAGSTGSGTLSYWTNVGCTTPLSSPSSVATSGTYYIKSTVGTCMDSKPVNVVVNTTPVLTIVNPTAVCLPGAVDLTAAGVTTGSTGGGTLSYWTNIGCTSPLATPTAVTTAGTYYIQSSLLTCTDVESVLVTISPAPVLTIVDPVSVCSPSTVDLTLASVTAGSTGSGTLSYWTNVGCTTPLSSPSSVATSGTYYIKSTNGTCIDSKPVNVVVNTTPVLTIVSPAAVCLPGAIDITAAAVTAGSTGGGTLTYWTNAACTNPLASPTSISISGTYYIQSTLLTCTDIEAVVVTISQSPTLNIINPPAVCSPLTVDLTLPSVTLGTTGSGVLSYWTNVGCTTPLTSPTAVSTSGTYYIKSTIGSCFDSKSVVVVVNTTPVLIITDPVAVCSPVTVDITASSITSGSTGSGILTYFSDASCTVSLTTPAAISTSGTYYIKSTSSSCFDIASVNVVVNLPITPLFNPINPICQGSNTPVLQSNSFNVPPIAGNWSPTVNISLPGTTVYTFTPTVGQCASTTSLSIVVNPLPLLFVNSPAPVCSPLKIDLTDPAVTLGSTGTISYFTNASGQTPLGSPSSISTSGTYFIEASTNLGCKVILPVVVSVNQKPIASFTPTPNVLNMYDLTSVMMNSSIGADTNEWIFSDGTFDNALNPSHLYPDSIYGEQLITLITTSSEGCKDTVTNIVTIEEELIFYVPNAFTPDEDKFNPTFQPIFTSGYDPYDYSLLIFNRWGEVVFESHDVTVGWNGKFGIDGVLSQDGLYTWRMEFKIKNKDKHVRYVGSLSLMK